MKDVFVVNDQGHTVEINGVTYHERENETRAKPNGKLFTLMAMMSAMGDIGYNSNYTRKRPKVHIPTEYGLIQLKKSNLSRSDRNWVVAVFESNYIKAK